MLHETKETERAQQRERKRAYMKMWYERKRESLIAKQIVRDKIKRKLDPDSFRNTKLRHRYKLDLTQFNALVEKQAGLCALCQKKPPVDVDHCHHTGRVRGLLCRGCNVGLGQMGDSIEGLQRAIEYLKSSGG